VKPAELVRYWHTIRYLRPVQIYGRACFRLHTPRPDKRPAPPPRPTKSFWQNCARLPRQTGPSQFTFVGQTREIAEPADWNRADWPKLWLYNLHYFDDLVADGANQRVEWHRDLVARWIAENPPGQGNGWEPYPLSLRLVNWCKWLLRGNEPIDGMLDSMAVQIRFLRGRLERHLLGNHLWANLKALVLAGTFFQGKEADRWRREALKLFRSELAEQVLPDGGHIERSPMYQATLTEDLLDLIQLDRAFPDVLPAQDVDSWREQARAMLDWLEVMSHPDGGLSFFNDAAFDIAPSLAALSAHARTVGLNWQGQQLEDAVHLDASGFVRVARGPAVALLDVAPIGPDYLPGHAHADTLSFELSLGEQRVLVNGGTSTYENNDQRRLERSTAMHNTVIVDGQDSSEVWDAFRVARRARVRDVSVSRSDGDLIIEAAHDGYRRLPGRVTHRRGWRMDDHRLLIEDRLDGAFSSAEARFRLAPGMSITGSGESRGQVSAAGIGLGWSCEGGKARIEDGYWHPRFGESLPCKVLVIQFKGDRISTMFEWQQDPGE